MIKTETTMSTIRIELYRGNKALAWAKVEVLNRNGMSITFTNKKNETFNIGILSKKDAEQLGDIIRNASINYMEDNEK